jgi:hypothetical protein
MTTSNAVSFSVVSDDAVGDEFLRELIAGALISARNEGDAGLTHRNSSSLMYCW